MSITVEIAGSGEIHVSTATDDRYVVITPILERGQSFIAHHSDLKALVAVLELAVQMTSQENKK